MVSSPVVVFQGELAVASGLDNLGSQILKTTKPLSCIVVSMHNSEKSVGALAHLDDYTDVGDAIEKICDLAKARFNAPCSPDYTATLFGGSDDKWSLKTRNWAVQSLKKNGIHALIDPLSPDPVNYPAKRPQIALDVLTGKTELLKGKKIDQRLEYVQRREYGEFNKQLNVEYAELNGQDIPFFKAKIAERHVANIPEFGANTPQELEETRKKERRGELRLPLSYSRQPARLHDEL